MGTSRHTDRRGTGEESPVDARGRRERSPETRRGRDDAHDVARPEDLRWANVVAGALAALTAFLLLGLLALGTDLLTEGAATVDWVSAIIGIIAFFVGGYVTGRTLWDRSDRDALLADRDGNGDRDAPSSGPDGSRGLTNGLLTWALATVLILVLSGFGLGQIFGPVGDLVGPLDLELIAESAREAALGAFFTLLAWALASAAGGRAGERADRRPDARPTPSRTRAS